MSEKLVVGPINSGLVKNREAFVIDNDSFPVLQNAYQWRGRVKRKRGTSFLSRLERYIDTTSTAYGVSVSTIAMSGGIANLLTGFSLGDSASIIPGSITITDTTSGEVYTDPASDGILVGNMGSTGTINYATGLITTSPATNHSISLKMDYYPSLPVMGLEDFIVTSDVFPDTIAFDPILAYKIPTTSPYTAFSVSFYNNPSSSGTYTQKTTWTPISWNGEDYQQFWSCNYQGAFWVTNGVPVPFNFTNIGMQYAGSTTTPALTAAARTSSTTVDFTVTGNNLVVGDYVFVNEFTAGGGGDASTLNFQTGYVTVAGDTFTVKFPDANITAGTYTPGIVQYLTNRSDSTKDCIRWYNGDPVSSASPPSFVNNKGWVNFCPPLSETSSSIGDLPKAIYYLVGAKVVLPFKDRLLFFGPVVQASGGSPIYMQDMVIYSQNGTPYYTASFSGSVTSATTDFTPLLVPDNQTAFPSSFFSDSVGFGGWIAAGLDQPIITVSSNEDVLMLGFDPTYQVRFVYTGNDIVPFNFYVVNSELGSSSTFSSVNLDKGSITRGLRGYVISSQVDVNRIDIPIPDEVFEINLVDNGNERFCAQRDFINEWIYFTYSSDQLDFKYPGKTLQYNYRDDSWAIFFETFTTYGPFRAKTGYTWATIGNKFPTWSEWNSSWQSGSSNPLQPKVIGGNTQGYVFIRDDGTDESKSLYITMVSFPADITGATNANPCVLTCTGQFAVGQQITISAVGGMTQLNGNTYTITAITPTTVSIDVDSTAFGVYTTGGLATPVEQIFCPNHCLNNSDYIFINNILGTSGYDLNNRIFSIYNVSTNGFSLLPYNATSGTYIGEGQITRYYIPFIQTKQFPAAWGFGRKTRIGPQKYLLTRTNIGQISLYIYLSEDADNAYNASPVIPDPDSYSDGLIYSQILYTCPESTNLGLTEANSNMLQLNAVSSNGTNSNNQKQIWHRVNTSLLGDTIQLGFSMNDTQMRTRVLGNISYDISGATQADPCVLTVTGTIPTGSIIFIDGVEGMVELNGGYFYVITSSSGSATIQVDSTDYDAYEEGGVATPTYPNFQTAEVELHGFIMDVSPSSMLA